LSILCCRFKYDLVSTRDMEVGWAVVDEAVTLLTTLLYRPHLLSGSGTTRSMTAAGWAPEAEERLTFLNRFL